MSVTPDLIVNAVALLAAVLALVPVAAARGGSAVAGRVFALLVGLVLLLGARILAWGGAGFAAVPLLLVASWLPLLALRLAEQLVRRHASAWMKWLVLGGGLAFSVCAVVFGAIWSATVLIALALFQGIAILCAVALLLGGRRDVSPVEARQAGIFVAALIVALPLSASDYRAFSDLPVRGGAFAVLILVLAIARLVGGRTSTTSLAIDVTALIGSGAMLAWGATIVWPAATSDQLIQIAAIAAAVAALALILSRRGEARLVEQARRSIVAALSALPDTAGVDAILSSHPLLATGRLVEGAALAPYPPALVDALATARVATRSDGDVASDLLDAQAATHLVRVSVQPPRFLAVSAGGLGAEAVTVELDMVARIVGRAA